MNKPCNRLKGVSHDAQLFAEEQPKMTVWRLPHTMQPQYRNTPQRHLTKIRRTKE